MEKLWNFGPIEPVSRHFLPLCKYSENNRIKCESYIIQVWFRKKEKKCQNNDSHLWVFIKENEFLWFTLSEDKQDLGAYYKSTFYSDNLWQVVDSCS